MANIIAIPFGLLLGAIAGYFGRRIDDLIVWFYTTMASIPGIIFLIALKFAFADRVAVMRHGSLLQVGRPPELYEQPRNAYVANLLGRTNMLPAWAEGSRLVTELGGIDPRWSPVCDGRVSVRPGHRR